MVKRWLLIYGYPRISRLRNLAKKALRKYGYEILEAENGEKALNVSEMPCLLQECFKIRRPVIVSDAQNMFPVKTDVRYQIECRAQSPAFIIV